MGLYLDVHGILGSIINRPTGHLASEAKLLNLKKDSQPATRSHKSSGKEPPT